MAKRYCDSREYRYDACNRPGWRFFARYDAVGFGNGCALGWRCHNGRSGHDRVDIIANGNRRHIYTEIGTYRHWKHVIQYFHLLLPNVGRHDHGSAGFQRFRFPVPQQRYRNLITTQPVVAGDFRFCARVRGTRDDVIHHLPHVGPYQQPPEVAPLGAITGFDGVGNVIAGQHQSALLRLVSAKLFTQGVNLLDIFLAGFGNGAQFCKTPLNFRPAQHQGL